MQHTICLVEDDDSIRELLVFNLESEGDRVMAFARRQPTCLKRSRHCPPTRSSRFSSSTSCCPT